MSLDQFLSPHSQARQGLSRLDQRLQAWRSQGTLFPNPPAVVQTCPTNLGRPDLDGVICGGTLGILLGAALAKRGWRIAVVERGILQGRAQEWNISRRELQVLLHLDLLSEADLEAAIATEFNPNRIQFLGGDPLWVRDILNVGLSPRRLLDQIKQTFLAAGGQIYEHHTLTGVRLHPDGVTAQTSTPNGDQTLTTRCLMDAMGHFSPLVPQARAQQCPDGLCLVVGSCARGLPPIDSGDLMVSFTPIQNHCQYFWEAFPAQEGRTTYLFTYADLHPQRPSLQQLFEDYFRLLPTYQDCDLTQFQLVRPMFGVFPSYRDSPLQLPWSRLLAVGDSSGQQSPLSFGGFGAMLRHLQRLTQGIHEALAADALQAEDLRLLQPYQPNLSAAWMFQQSMSPPVNQNVPPQQINQLLNQVFQTMTQLGDPVLEPFLQDVVQFGGLTQTLLTLTARSPLAVPPILHQVGLANLLAWLPHYGRLGGYSLLAQWAPAVQAWSRRLPPTARYRWHRRAEAWVYGAGLEGDLGSPEEASQSQSGEH